MALSALAGAAIGSLGIADARAGCSLAIGTLALVSIGNRTSRRAVLLVCVFGALLAHAAIGRTDTLAPSLGIWFGSAPAGNATAPTLVAGRIVNDAAKARGGGVRLIVDVTDVGTTTGRQPVSGRVRLHVSGTLAEDVRREWTRGRFVEVPATLRWPAFERNPGSPSLEWQALTREYVLAGSVKSAALVHIRPGRSWDELAAGVRRFVRLAMARTFQDDTVARGVTTAILIGDREGLDPEVEERLIDAGTYHVLAISGGNIAVLTTAVFVLAGFVFRSARLVALVSLIVVASYGAVVFGEPSVGRAVAAAMVWLVARAAGVDVRPLPVFSTVALIVLVVDPLAVVNAGAWLSFGATFGILALAEPIERLIWPHAGSGKGRFHLLISVLAASLAVQIVLIPVGALVFTRVALGAPLLNLVAVPAMTIVQMAGLVSVMTANVLPDVAATAGAIGGWSVHAIVRSPDIAAGWWSWRVAAPPVWWVVLFYVLSIGSVAMTWPGRWRAVIVSAAGLLLAGLPILPAAATHRSPDGWLRVTMLDVGQGDATVIRFPRGKHLIIDGGNRTVGFDTGDRVAVPALLTLGLGRADWVAMSHADRDHAGGLPSIVSTFSAREVWEGVPVPGDSARSDVRRAADHVGASWRELRAGDRLVVDDVSVDVLHPPAPDWERRRVRNDDSLVFRVRWNAFDLLLTGDIGERVEADVARAISSDPGGSIRILKVPHHGSRTSTTQELLKAFRPWVAVVSVGRNNAFGHPAASVLSRLAAAGAETIRTDRDGAATIETDGRAVRVSMWSERLSLVAIATDAPRP